MKYVSGIQALNLGDRSKTPGDWHHGAMDWSRPYMLDTETSPFGSYDIDLHKVPEHGLMPVASHVRACLDLIEQGYFSDAQGMRANFISNDQLDQVIMDKIWLLRNRSDWPQIANFMGHEYLGRWLDYCEAHLEKTR